MPRRAAPLIDFDVWGSRGSHAILPARSRVANDTSCYSVLHGEDLFAFDAGRGLVRLGHALEANPRFEAVRNVHVLVTHAHLDHWEGLKDVSWFWRRGNGLEVTLYGTRQGLGAIQRGFAHPAYVPLDVLALGTLGALRWMPLEAGERRRIGPFTLTTFPLNHYSGGGRSKRFLDTVGFRLGVADGPVVSYLSDHEPTAETRSTEDAALRGAHLAVYDAHFRHIREHMYGHGSQEHAARMARAYPNTRVLAGHIGPMLTDAEVFAAHRQYSRGVGNFGLAIQGTRFAWSRRKGSFDPAGSGAAR
jgi:phosphoribosyl 1,2-cyclic phosphodiesterase